MSASWLMVLASFLFATMGVCVKLASADYTPGEVMFYRGVIGAMLMWLVARHRGVSLRTPVPATQDQSRSFIARRYHSWNCCMPSSIGLW